MTLKYYIFFLFLPLIFFSAEAQSYDAVQFIENKGQWDSRVKFMGDVPGGAVFVHQTGFTVMQHKPEDWKRIQDAVHGHNPDKEALSRNQKFTIHSHAYEVKFVNAAQPSIIADKPLPSYNNYFIGNDTSKWASGCKIYQGITLQNIYPNIDVRYYSDNGQMKYDLIVKPGGRVSDIALEYTGADALEIKDKQLIVKTSIGNVKELSPYTYQNSGKGRKSISCNYIVKGNTVRFDVKGYDDATTLVIDPTMIFASFSGSKLDNWGFTATYGPDGSLFGGGIVSGLGFPTTPGAYQTSYGGDKWDIGIMKLSPNGSQNLFATYIGGSGIEQPHSLFVDPQGNVVIAGRTNSPRYPDAGAYPTTGAEGFIGAVGGYDIIVTKLNATGTALIGSKRIGGSGDDGVNINATRAPFSLQKNYGDDGRSEVILDGANNIYVASCTQSTNFPIRGGGFQSTFGGKQDGVVLKLTPDVSGLMFSTYLGGKDNDAAYVLSLNPSDNSIYVGGGTESTNFPTTAGTISSSSNGGIDGFVAVLNNSGTSLLRATYIGTGGTDQVFGVQFDRFGIPYIMGQTTGSWQAKRPPGTSTFWSQTGGKQFVAKIKTDLSDYIYSTMFGTGSALPNISPTAFLVDRCENVYVSGWGGELSGFPSGGTAGLPTKNALYPATDGSDFYFFVLKRDATDQLYGDFYGQSGGLPDHVDGGTSRFDRNGVIYQAICANCDNSPKPRYPTTPGSAYPANGSPQCNMAMVKIAINLAGVHAGVQPSINGVPNDSSGCVPLTVTFTDTIQSAVSYEWNFGDGSPQVTTIKPDTSHTYTRVGLYRVMLIGIDPSTCNVRDTSYITIKVGDLIAQVGFNAVKLNPCDSFKYRFDNTSIAPAARPYRPNSFVWDFGDGSPRVTGGTNSVFHNYAKPGTYRARLYLTDTAYCNYPDSAVIPVRVAQLVKANFTTPRAGCVPYGAVFTNTSSGGQQFLWNFGDGTTSTQDSPTHLYTTPGTYIIKLKAVDSATCNIVDSTSFTITLTAKPTADYSVLPQPPLVNTPIMFTNLSSPDAIRFKWSFGDGDSLITTSRAPLSHEYNATKTYDTYLIAFNANGCPDTAFRQVRTLIEPALDVPNAFTPLSGDANNRIFVRGFAIGKMKFTIWNRWGQKMFEAGSKNNGWDGKYKGMLQPMDVYAYTLDVEFTDGTKATKKGDITLIR